MQSIKDAFYRNLTKLLQWHPEKLERGINNMMALVNAGLYAHGIYVAKSFVNR